MNNFYPEEQKEVENANITSDNENQNIENNSAENTDDYIELTHEDFKDVTDVPIQTVEFSKNDYLNQNEEIQFDAKIGDYHEVKYTSIEKKHVSKGVKAFALIMVAVILATCSCTIGYFLGINSLNAPENYYSETVLNLESKPKDTDEMTPAQVYEMLNKSVVGITVYGEDGSGSSASGVVYTEDGYIITNDHIYSEVIDAKFIVKTYDGKEYSAKFVAGDVRSDLAVLKINADGFTPAVFGNDNEIIIGENVVAVGRPNNIEENSITEGIVSLTNRRVSTTSSYSMKMIQTSTPINPGNSGGALVNMYGQVIGITSSKIAGEEYEGIGFAIPSSTTKKIIESLIKNGYVADRGRLGISYQVINSVIKELKKYPNTGILIATIDTDSHLYGKINEGDIITQVNGIDITSDSIVLDAIENAKPGEDLVFTVYTTSGDYKNVKASLLPDTGSSSYKKSIVR